MSPDGILKPDDLPQFDGFCCGHSYLKYSDINGCTCNCDQCLALNCDKSAPTIQYQVKKHAKLETNVLVKETKLDFDEKSDTKDETKQESVGVTSSSNSKNGAAHMPSPAAPPPLPPATQTNGASIASDNKVSFVFCSRSCKNFHFALPYPRH